MIGGMREDERVDGKGGMVRGGGACFKDVHPANLPYMKHFFTPPCVRWAYHCARCDTTRCLTPRTRRGSKEVRTTSSNPCFLICSRYIHPKAPDLPQAQPQNPTNPLKPTQTKPSPSSTTQANHTPQSSHVSSTTCCPGAPAP